MSHEAHHEEHHEGPEIDITKSKPAFFASFWFVFILACLFIAALNFVNIMSQPEEGHGGHEGTHTEAAAHEGHATEATHEAAPAAHEEAAHEGAPAEEAHAEKH